MLTCISVDGLTQTTAEIDRLRMHADAGRDEHALSALFQAAHAGNVEAQRAAGEALLRNANTQSIIVALGWLERAAIQGDLPAMLALGKTYLLGHSSRPPDYPKAIHWFTRAYTQKSPQAAYYLGLMYKSGYGIAVNSGVAARYFEFAAAKNIADAMYELGNAHTNGDGVDEDRPQAMRWYMRAAALEHPLAIQELANAYARGDSMLPQSDLQATLMSQAIDHALKHPKARP
jgi:uncharacterized protein